MIYLSQFRQESRELKHSKNFRVYQVYKRDTSKSISRIHIRKAKAEKRFCHIFETKYASARFMQLMVPINKEKGYF